MSTYDLKIEHVAIWTADLERLKAFYTNYFGATAGPLYINPRTNFSSCFLAFAGGARLELMQMEGTRQSLNGADGQFSGISHIAISLGTESEVDRLTARLRKDGYRLVGRPRRTGDGYYESVVLDPDGNRLELTI